MNELRVRGKREGCDVGVRWRQKGLLLCWMALSRGKPSGPEQGRKPRLEKRRGWTPGPAAVDVVKLQEGLQHPGGAREGSKGAGRRMGLC